MAFWFTFFLWVASFVVSDYLRPRLPARTPSGLGDFNVPTATEGRYVPIMTGLAQIAGPNCTWYGDFAAAPRTVKTGVIFRRQETIGFTYHLALQYAQVRGQVKGITGVWIGDDKVFDADTDTSGVAQTVVDINRPDLFGGTDMGGGFIGRLRLHTGAQDQAVSTYLSGGSPVRQDPTPAYRGTAYLMITDTAETAGANIGESNSLREIRVELQAFDTVANGALGDALDLGNDHHFIGKNINPIVWAYEVLTNVDWGRNLPPSDIDIDNFKAAAEICYTEGIGFSRVYDQLLDASEILDEVEQHADGYIGPNPITGQLEITLARDGYTLASEYQATPDNILDVPKWSKADWGQTFNEVKVQFADRAKAYKDTYATAQSLANLVIQGRKKTRVLRFPGVHDAEVANKLVWRASRAFFRALASGTIVLDRTGYQLRPGSILSLTSELADESNLACRVTAIRQGNEIRHSMTVDIVQDVFGTETQGFVNPPASSFVRPVQGVVAFAAADQAAVEAPRVMARYDQEPDAAPRILTFARVTGGTPTGYEVIRRVRTSFGTGSYGAFASSAMIESGFMAVGELRGSLGQWVSGNGSFSIEVDPINGNLDDLFGDYSPNVESAAGIAVIAPGTAAEEWLAFTSIVDDGAGISLEGVWRACCDTGMIEHAAGDRVWFIWTGGLGLPLETYTAGNGVECKFLPTSPSASILEAGATALAEVRIHNSIRNTRPLMPRRLDLNGSQFPAGNVDFDAAITGPSIGVEVDVYLRLWRVNAIIDSVRGLDQGGAALAAADLAGENMTVSVWLYDLDTTPTPVRGDAIASVIDQAVTGPIETVLLDRADVISGGPPTSPFNARIELEVAHEPDGTSGVQVSLKPLFFDFTGIGTF